MSDQGPASDGIAPVTPQSAIPPLRAMESLRNPPAPQSEPRRSQPEYTAEELEEIRQLAALRNRRVDDPFDAPPAEPAADTFNMPDGPPREGDASPERRHPWEDQSWLSYLGIIYVEYHREHFDDFISGRMGLQLASFLKAIPRGVGQGATGAWDTFKNAYDGWKSILNDPAVLAELDDATKDAVKAIEAHVHHLDALAQANDPRFGEAIGELTGQAMFDGVTGRAQDVLLKKAATGPGLTRAATNAAGDAVPGGPVLHGPSPAPPPTRLTTPPGAPPPLPERVQPVHNASARRHYPGPETRASTPHQSHGTPQQLDRSACAIATVRGILRDLGHFVPDEAWLIELARSMGLFHPGMKAAQLQKFLDKLTDLRMIPKLHVDVFSVLDLAKAFGSTVAHPTRLVAWMRRYFPDSPLLGGLITMSGGGHAVRLEGIAKGLVSVGDPGMATGRSVVTSTRQLDRMLDQVVVLTPEGKPRPPAWIPRSLDAGPPGVPAGTLLKAPDTVGAPLARAGATMAWPFASWKALFATGVASISAVIIAILVLSFLLAGDDPAPAASSTGQQEPSGSSGSGAPGGEPAPPQVPPGSTGPPPVNSVPPAGPSGGQEPPIPIIDPPPVVAPPPATNTDPPPVVDPPPSTNTDPPPATDPPPPPPAVDPPPPPPVVDPPPAPPLQSGIYNGTFMPLVHNHACCINPPGQGIVVFRFTGAETGMFYFEIHNLFGAFAPDLKFAGGPFPPGEAFTIGGTGTFLGVLTNVPVTLSGTLGDRILRATVQIGPAGLPGNLSSTWTLEAEWVGPLP